MVNNVTYNKYSTSSLLKIQLKIYTYFQDVAKKPFKNVD